MDWAEVLKMVCVLSFVTRDGALERHFFEVSKHKLEPIILYKENNFLNTFSAKYK